MASSNSNSSGGQKKAIILSKSEDWSTWIAFIRIKATNANVWHLIDPDLPSQPTILTEPVGPELIVGDVFDQGEWNLYKVKEAVFRSHMAKYEKQKQAFDDIINYILETVSAQNAVLIQHVKTANPWDMLRTLKNSVAPSDIGKELQLRNRYEKLRKGPTNQNIETWISEWQQMFHEATAAKISEVQGAKPIMDFLLAIRSKHPSYADAEMTYLARKPNKRDMHQYIDAYRQHVRITAAAEKSGGGEHSAFAARKQGKQSDNAATFRGNKVDAPPCICGKKHWYGDCFYYNPAIKPAYWKENSEIREKINESLKDPTVLKRVKNSIAKTTAMRKGKDKETATSSSSTAVRETPSTSESKEKEKMTFATFKVLATKSSVQNIVVLDCAADIHVCNEAMKHRFTKERDAGWDDRVLAGDNNIKIQCFGSLELDVDTPTGPQTITLLNVAYIPTFLTSIASMSLFEAKGVHFDTQVPHLHRKGETVIQIYKLGGHYTFKQYNQQPEPVNKVFATAKKSRTAIEWHSIMAHASPEAIMHLENSTNDVIISDVATAKVPKTNECETCALTKSHVQISRTSHKSETSDKPFYRVSFDLMQFNTSYNGDQWCSHLACLATNFNLAFTHSHKSEARSILKQAFMLIKQRFNGTVVFLRVDGETSLNLNFQDELKELGITYEASAPYTPAQNGHAERQGGVLAMKARALRIEAGLPANLWNEAIRTAAYIANRTPMHKHNWKTPFEKVTSKAPNLSHLKAYGCKAYAHIHNLPKKMKLEERAHVGHLVGYDSTNIFRIWIPSRQRVIRTRDVMFNEGKFYDPSEPDLSQLITEPMIETTFETAFPQHFPNTLSSIELDPDDVDITDVNASEDVNLQPVESIDKATETVIEPHLPTPEITPTPEPETAAGPSDAGPSKLHKQKAKHDVSADFDAANILPEGVKRTRKQKYAAALEAIEAIQKFKDYADLRSYHNAFSAFSTAIKFYETAKTSKLTTHQSKTVPSTTSPRLHRDSLPPEPKNLRELNSHPFKEEFKGSMRVEIKDLQGKGTWEEVSENEAKDKESIPTTWVFRYKFDDEGYLVKFKARLCARGDLQKTEMDTYAATLAARVFRALMALIAAHDMETRQYDAVNAFANSDLNETTYCRPPWGWEGRLHILLKLLKALYGLKQSPALWYKHLAKTLIRLGLEAIPGIECCFVSDSMIVFFFVDDITVIYEERFTKEVDDFERELFNTYEMRKIGELEWFLGIKIIRDRENKQLWLSQESYIEKIVNKFNLNDHSRRYETPLPVETIIKHAGQATPQEIYAFQQRVGSVNFASVITRPDISHASSKLAEHLMNPSPRHMELVDRLIIYLGNTKQLTIHFDGLSFKTREIFLGNVPNEVPDEVFIGSSDASYGDDPHTRYSSQGYIFTLYGGPIDWKAGKQKTVTLSTTEAELLALSATARETIWWERFFETIDFNPGHKTSIECDNKQTIRAFLADNAKYTTKLRHVDIHRHWLRQEVKKGTIAIRWTPTAVILADGLTKALSVQRHKEFIRLIGMQIKA